VSAYNTGQAGTDGEGLREHLIGSASRLGAAILERLTKELPVYRKLPAEQLTGDVARMIRRSIDGFVQALRSGRMLGPGQLGLLTSSATRRAEEGLPAEAIVSAYFLGARLCFDDVAATAGPADLPAVTAMYSLLLEYLQHVTTAVTAGYLQQMQITVGERHGARQLLLTALLEGRVDEEAAREAGLTLPPAYLVLALAVGPHPDEHTPGVDTNAAAMRKLRRLRTEPALHSRGAALSSLTTHGGLILLPNDTGPTAYGPAHWDDIRRLLTRLQRAAGTTVLAAAVPALPGDVAEMCPVAAEPAHLATASARPPGLYRLEDLAVEHQPAFTARSRPRPRRPPPRPAGRSSRPSAHADRLPAPRLGPPRRRRSSERAPQHRALPTPQNHRAHRPRRHTPHRPPHPPRCPHLPHHREHAARPPAGEPREAVGIRRWSVKASDKPHSEGPVEGAGDAGEGEEVVGLAFVASVEAAAADEPGHGPDLSRSQVSGRRHRGQRRRRALSPRRPAEVRLVPPSNHDQFRVGHAERGLHELDGAVGMPEAAGALDVRAQVGDEAHPPLCRPCPARHRAPHHQSPGV
jgi:hypothetical protein